MAQAKSRIAPQDITGLVLAGGRGSRMGGVDKGLQLFNGAPLVLHALQRLSPQVGHILINANRNVERYRAFDVPVFADGLADFAGPLAGFLVGLQHCETPYLLTVPCDTPLFPADLASRLVEGLQAEGADMAIAWAPEANDDGSETLRPQPVFCLMRANLRENLVQFTEAGGRKVGAWIDMHKTALVPFDHKDDSPDAFLNANTLAELRALEQQRAAP